MQQVSVLHRRFEITFTSPNWNQDWFSVCSSVNWTSSRIRKENTCLATEELIAWWRCVEVRMRLTISQSALDTHRCVQLVEIPSSLRSIWSNSTGRESRNSIFHSSTFVITNMRSMRNHVMESSEIHAESLSHNILVHIDSAELTERAAARHGISATPSGRAEDQTESWQVPHWARSELQ